MTAIALKLPRAAAEAADSFNAYLLNVTFEDPDGERRSAIGGGDSVPEAIAAARDELPPRSNWMLVRWNPVYGE
jgi:hypothetical protein